MKYKVLVTFSGLFFIASQGWSQPHIWSDTIDSGHILSHMYLNIEIPQGDVVMKSSEICGSSISRLTTPNEQVKHQIKTQTDQHGNHLRTVVLSFPEPAKQEMQAKPAPNLRMAEQMTDISLFGELKEITSEYFPDPSMSTDLYLNLGSGESSLDLSGLSLKNVSINSAFSDVLVSYTEANQVRMKEMDIHAAKANIKVDHAELANAELITIQNDMGELELILGDKQTVQSTIYLQLGVGSCSLLLSNSQPVRLVVKSGLISSVNIEEETFEEKEKGVYTNRAYEALADKKKATKIICNIDMGSVTVVGKK
ncbi:MAG: hypothetical protein AAF587_28155 [Bacteroidota bacterium]